jgi:hypothetical protein
MKFEGKSLSSLIPLITGPEGKQVVDPGTIAGIVLAIIGCVGAAAYGTEAIIQREMSRAKQSGAKICGGLGNKTLWGWKPMDGCNKPYHGHWGNPPARTNSLTSVIVELAEILIMERRNDEENPDPNYPMDNLLEFQADLLARFNEAAEKNKELSEEYVSVISLFGDNMGGESVAIYEFVPENEYESDNDWVLALYLKKKPGGDYWAGAMVCTKDWLDNSGLDYEGKGKEFFEFLRDNSTPEPMMHNASSNGVNESLEIDVDYQLDLGDLIDGYESLVFDVKSKIHIGLCGGEEVMFDITQNVSEIIAVN